MVFLSLFVCVRCGNVLLKFVCIICSFVCLFVYGQALFAQFLSGKDRAYIGDTSSKSGTIRVGARMFRGRLGGFPAMICNHLTKTGQASDKFVEQSAELRT